MREKIINVVGCLKPRSGTIRSGRISPPQSCSFRTLFDAPRSSSMKQLRLTLIESISSSSGSSSSSCFSRHELSKNYSTTQAHHQLPRSGGSNTLSPFHSRSGPSFCNPCWIIMVFCSLWLLNSLPHFHGGSWKKQCCLPCRVPGSSSGGLIVALGRDSAVSRLFVVVRW